ncbi:hypothetical protein EC844_11652 [Acinetobacter calcoaceticus]|uniref:Uncharacterized protein n=1 Tax=Acinetobacter calcoaceticus TaxID=471 RepID=A0A4R1XNR2_ACICA|nr:hypothetical protein EC844_11652 [Acinetobacter calcoaceticus]
MDQHGAIEIGMFKLKAEVQLEDAILAYTHMVRHFLSQQADWQAQSLIVLEDQTLIDLAWSKNIAAAKTICKQWMDNPACLKFLSLIDPMSMQFGQVLHIQNSQA